MSTDSSKAETFLILKHGSLEAAINAWKKSKIIKVNMEGFSEEESDLLLKEHYKKKAIDASKPKKKGKAMNSKTSSACYSW